MQNLVIGSRYKIMIWARERILQVAILAEGEVFRGEGQFPSGNLPGGICWGGCCLGGNFHSTEKLDVRQKVLEICRSSHRRCYIRKGVLRNFT